MMKYDIVVASLTIRLLIIHNRKKIEKIEWDGQGSTSGIGLLLLYDKRNFTKRAQVAEHKDCRKEGGPQLTSENGV